MTPRIIEECRKKMYEAIWLEIDRDPQRPAVARVDINTKAGSICVWCDSVGNIAVLMDDWREENSQHADKDPMDAFSESRLDILMAQLV